MRALQDKTRRGGSKLDIERVSAKFKKGFTLAEVLITLAIIGVVAAITMPVLIQKHRNHTVETRLKKFYTVMNQAVLMSEAEYGPKELWDFTQEDFFETHFAPYLNIVRRGDNYTKGSYVLYPVYFSDGSLTVNVLKYNNSIYPPMGCNRDFYFFPNAKNFDPDTFDLATDHGTTYFEFQFYPTSTAFYQKNKGVEPFAYGLNQDLSNLKTGQSMWSCNTTSSSHYYCSFYIMSNGWKIPNDYPFKVR